MPRTKKTKEEEAASLEDSVVSVLNGGEPIVEEEQPVIEENVSEPEGAKEEEEVVADTDNLEESKEGEPAPSVKIKVGEVEYDQDELNALLEKGKLAKQIEQDQNTDLSKIYPEFTRRSQLLKNPEALKSYVKENYGYDIAEKPVSEEEKVLKEQIEKARQAGFLVKDDTQEIINQVLQVIEVKELNKTIDNAVEKHKVNKDELVDFMGYLKTRDADSAAQKLAFYKQAVSAKPVSAPTPTPAPRKPEVLKTENKGNGVRVMPKEKPIPHPDKDPEGYAARIMEFLSPKSPEEV